MSEYKSALSRKPDYLVCSCMGVMYSEIKAAIEQGHTTVEQLQETLLVTTGCTSCVADIHHILTEEQKLAGEKQSC